MLCSLCASKTNVFSEVQHKKYLQCNECNSVMLDHSFFLSKNQERERYNLHQNDVYNLGYQNSVSTIIEKVVNNHSKHDKGLDFGSGTNSVVSYLLKNKNYDILEYDPIFKNKNDVLLDSNYDYIICCEVVEHFYRPIQEFQLLSRLLKPNGTLYCKTKLFTENINFDTWWYKNDPTHVFFYTPKSINWIKNKFNFGHVEVAKDVIIFQK
ncbi:methyltransferase domain-containing protein [Aquimarina algicola]|uniref:Class I SAM-dependent methyltransferase n=1 Tax=Aquimarina algicola TaxID=2589995 RepID=A0A504J1Q0_9FLAO|nr:methyltransferase domain-containing protein [Aquimarina algicola]TPN84796.1 class I SAM-dependent methyltransferase [Aquimarina algicola]